MQLLCLSVLGVAFLCLPAVTSEERDQCSPGQLLGMWYIRAIASNCEWMVQFIVKEMMTCNITSHEEGSFTITTNFMTEYGPMEIDMTYKKQSNGIYLHKSEWGDKIIEKTKTDCKSYAITCVRDVNENDGKLCKFVSLYSRAISVPHSVKQSYIDFATEMQIDREQIFFLARKDAATISG